MHAVRRSKCVIARTVQRRTRDTLLQRDYTIGHHLNVVRGAWLAFLLVAACGDTRIRVTIEGDGALAVDSYQLRVADRLGIGDPLTTLDVIVRDEIAGAPQTIELWALYAGQQVAYGKAMVTPEEGSTVDVTVGMTPMACGMWCTPGALSCDGDGTRECVQATSGCLELGPTTACPASAPFCSNGSCSATCSDECTEGMSACDGAVAVRTCGQFDTDECTDWSSSTSCGANQRCTNGSCGASQTCVNTGDDCDDGNGCTDGDVCTGSTCGGEPRDCANAPPTCQSTTTLRLYGQGGSCSMMTGACTNSYVDATCIRGCLDGACKPHIAAGGTNNCAITANGMLDCWGQMSTTTLPTQTFAAVAVSRYHGCGTTTTGATVCWQKGFGDNFAGECDVPVGVTFKAVGAGLYSSCGIIASTGALQCWGESTHNQLVEPTGSFVSVSVGYEHACAVRNDGTAACWGRNDAGQSSAPGTSFLQVAAGDKFSCGIHPGGAIECWGTITGTIPTGSFVSISAGFDHACALRSDGAAKCWGVNSMGKATAPSGTFSAVVAGEQHSCGTLSDGTIDCWGDNTNGETDVPPGL